MTNPPNSPLSNARAAMIVIQGESETGYTPGMLSLGERQAIDRVIRPGQDYLEFCWAQLGSLDRMEQRIARLEGHILLACDDLAAWLSDNTEDVFEEQPEIDDVRCNLWEAVHDDEAVRFHQAHGQ